MKEYIKKLFSTPTNLEEQRVDDSRSYKIAFVGFLTTAIILGLAFLRNWSLKEYTEDRTLSYIILLNILGFVISSDLSYRFSKKARNLKSFLELKKMKLTFYFVFTVIVGVPYMYLALWHYSNGNISISALLILLFFVALLFLYDDWKRFVRVQRRSS